MNIFIWGRGKYGKGLYSYLSQKSQHIICGFIDSAINDAITDEGIEVISDKFVKLYYEQGKLDGVIIGVSDKYYREIENELYKLNIPILNIPFLKKTMCFESSINLLERHIDLCEGIKTFRGKINILVDIFNQNVWMYKDEVLLCEFTNYRSAIDDNIVHPYIPIETNNIFDYNICGEIFIIAKMWSTNYWHFVYEALPLVFDLEQKGYRGKYFSFYTQFAEGFFDLLKVDKARIIWAEEGKNYSFTDGITYEPTRFEDKKVSNVLISMFHFFEEEYELKDSSYPKFIFVERIGTRKWTNIKSSGLLERYHFCSVKMEEKTVLEQIKLFYNAQIVLLPHGAASANVLFMKPKCAVIEAFGKTYINPCCIDIAKKKELFYQMITERLNGGNSFSLDGSADYCIEIDLTELAIKNSMKYNFSFN